MNLMTLENISKSYSEKILLKDISLGINEGEKIGIIGVNGIGKSTLLKIIAGVEVPDDGTIIKANRVRVEYLPQNPDYNEDFTVLQQVFKGTSSEMKLLLEYEETLTALSNNYNDNLNSKLISFQEKIDALNLWDLESEAKAVLTKLGITNFNQKVKELSGGQRKRVSLASALITPCELLILDEPTAGLDPKGRDDILEQIKLLHEKYKMTIVLVSHSMEDVGKLAQRIVVMNKGKVELLGKPSEVFKEVETLEKIGLAVPQVTYLMRVLRERGFDVSDEIFTVEKGTEAILKVLSK